MKCRLNCRLLLGWTIAIGFLSSGPAMADGGNILGGFLNAMANAMVAGSWQKVDSQTQDCLASKFNMNPADLAQQGVLATDPRVTPYIQQCQQIIAQGGEQGAHSEQASLQQPANSADDPQRRSYLTGRFGRKHADLIIQGQIDIGMNQEEVMLAWGDPGAKNLKGKASEVWTYGNDNVVFAHGKVSAVTH